MFLSFAQISHFCMVEQFGGFLNAVCLRHIFWLTPNRTHTWCFKLTHSNTVHTYMHCTFLHVLQIVTFCCRKDNISFKPEFPHIPRNITEKSDPNSYANNVSSEGDCLESLPKHRLTKGCSVPVSRPTSRPVSGEEFPGPSTCFTVHNSLSCK